MTGPTVRRALVRCAAMRAVVCSALGPLGGLTVSERQPPVAGPGQVVVDMRAAGVTFVDALMARGGYQIKPPTPYVPGGEVAGTVAALGDGVADLAVGQRVVAFCGLGAFAEQVVAPALGTFALPDAIADGQAASMLQAYGTAFFTFRIRTQVGPGEWVLVLGAGGGLGLAFVDVARALGARVIAAASTPEKLAAATAMGADATIAYEDVDLKTAARELSDGGVDVVIDNVGGAHAEPALRALKLFGRFCVVGFAAGTIPSVPLNQVLLNNRTVVGVEWGGWAGREPHANRAMLEELMAMAGDGRLHPVVPEQHPLTDAATVMQRLIDRDITGKAVLVP
jgi:NADPH:quinone reductase